MKKLEEMIRVVLLPELSPRSRREVERVMGELQSLRSSYRRLQPRLRRQREEAVILCEELLSHSPEERFRRIRLTRHRLRSRPLVEELLRRSFVAGFEDPREARHLAELASRVTLSLFGAEELAGGTRGLNDLQAAVLGHQGHACRRDGRSAEAKDFFDRCLRFLGLGTGGRRVLAQAHLLHCQLLRDLRRWQEAKGILEDTLESLEEVGNDGLRGRALVLLASVHCGRGDEAGAQAALLEACVLIDEDRDPHLARSCWNQLAAIYAETGHEEAAEGLLEEPAATFGALPPGSAAAARRDWAVARTRIVRGCWQEARAGLERARGSFLARGLRIEGALASLDLGIVLAASGEVRELGAVAADTGRRVAGEPLGRELSSALGSFLEACREGLPPQQLLRQLQQSSRRCRYLGDWGG